jgi:hypothetical protein
MCLNITSLESDIQVPMEVITHVWELEQSYYSMVFFLPTIFKDVSEFFKSCDECKRVENFSRIKELPMNYILPLEPIEVWGFDFMGHFPSSSGYTHISVAVIMSLNGCKQY